MYVSKQMWILVLYFESGFPDVPAF